MAYQPIELPNNMGIVPGRWPGLATGADAFMQARQQEIANNQARANALLKRQEFDETHLRNEQIDARANREIATEEENNRRKNAADDRAAAGTRNANIRKALSMARDRPIEAAAALQQEGIAQEDIDRIVQQAQQSGDQVAGGAAAPTARLMGMPPGAPAGMPGPGAAPPQFGPPPAPPPGPQLPSGPPPSQAAGLAPPPMQQDATGLPTGPGQAPPPGPQGFDQWYAGEAQKLGINPNPDDPRHHYDYRAFYKAMLAGQVPPPEQTEGHFSSQFKTDGNEREMLKDRQGRVFNTRSGTYADGSPVSEEELRAATTAPTLSPQEAQGPPPNETPDEANRRRANILRFRDPKSGQQVTFDTQEDERATEAERQRFFAKADAALRQYGPDAPEFKAYLGGLKMLSAVQPMKSGEMADFLKDNYKTDRMAEATVRAAQLRPRSDSNEWRRDQGERHLSQDEETKAFSLANTVLDNLTFPKENLRNQKFNDMARQLASGNAGVDTVIAGEFAKEAQGGAGVLSNSDMEVFWDRIGAVDDRTDNYVKRALTGQMGEGKRAIVAAAVKDLAGVAQQNLRRIQGQLASMYDRSANFRAYKDQVLSTYFNDYKPSGAAPIAPPSMTEVRRARVVRSGGAPAAPAAMDADLNSLLDLLSPKK